MSRVVRIKRQGGKVVQNCDVYIGRQCHMGGWSLKQSKWHNPFPLKQYTMEESLKKYEEHVRGNKELMESLHELEGKTLGCWCLSTDKVEPLQCHGQVLMKLLREK